MKKRQLKINGNLVVLTIALVVVIAAFSLLNKNYFTVVNMTNILIAASLVGLVAIGHTFLIIEGQNDLSPGSLVAFLGVLSALLVKISQAHASVLTITQSLPIHDKASVTISLDISEMSINMSELVEELSRTAGVEQLRLLAVE